MRMIGERKLSLDEKNNRRQGAMESQYHVKAYPYSRTPSRVSIPAYFSTSYCYLLTVQKLISQQLRKLIERMTKFKYLETWLCEGCISDKDKM